MSRGVWVYGGIAPPILLLMACCTRPPTPVDVPTPTGTAAVQTPTSTATPPSPTPSPIVTPPPFVPLGTPQAMECQTGFEQDASRHTLSAGELRGYLALMGIESLCIPRQLGAPFLAADWNSEDGGAIRGRMLSIGFESLYDGSGWGEGFLVYATYDFAAGTEFDVFATREDREALVNGRMPGAIEVNGVRGFVRFQPCRLCTWTQRVYKVTAFPFDTDYVAVVYETGEYDPRDVEEVMRRLEAGECPANRVTGMQATDFLARSIQFRPPP